MTAASRKPERPPNLAYEHNFCRITQLDGMEVSLAYDLDRERWPWLALPSHHPVLVEKYQYFSAVTAGWAALDHAPEVHSALTKLTWYCESASFMGQQATQGHCKLWQNERDMGYELTTLTDKDQVLTHYTGTGFAFADRDFKAWRAKARQAALERAGRTEVPFADPATVGLNADGISFVSPLRETDGQSCVTACVTTQRGFYPTHPFHTGSGDHVNAGHLLDCALQAAHLVLNAARPLSCIGGSAEFRRFIELDVPFAIRLVRRDTSARENLLLFNLEQLGRENACVSLRLTKNQSETR